MERAGGDPDSIRYRPIRATDLRETAPYDRAVSLMGIRVSEALVGRSWSFVS
jgi:hypothetical protein